MADDKVQRPKISPEDIQIVRDSIELGRQDGDIATLHVERLEDLLENYANLETELRDTKRALEMACANDTWTPDEYLEAARKERLGK